LHSKRTINVI